jgi:hypothetical protein
MAPSCGGCDEIAKAVASESRERSAAAERRARERVGGLGAKPPDQIQLAATALAARSAWITSVMDNRRLFALVE